MDYSQERVATLHDYGGADPDAPVDRAAAVVPMTEREHAALAAEDVLAGLAAIFFPMYYLFPNADVTIREVLPGAVVAAISWASPKSLFEFYVATASQYQAYGVVDGVILLVTWLYFGGFVLLFGVVINVVAAGRVELDEPESDEGESRFQEALAHSRRLWREGR